MAPRMSDSPPLPPPPHQHAEDAANEEAEARHFQDVLLTFESYLRFSLASNNLRRRSYNVLSKQQRSLLNTLGPALPLPDVVSSQTQSQQPPPSPASSHSGFKARLDEIDDRIRRNAAFLDEVVVEASELLGNSHDRAAAAASDGQPPKDLDKVRSIFKQLVRDWSTNGHAERTHAYQPILSALDHLFHSTPITQRAEIKILTPGCGLGRLPWEIAMRGFSSQGNEFSLFMLVVSNYILNKTTRTSEHTIYPWMHSMSNWRSAAQPLQPVAIPDVDPNDLTTRYAASREHIAPPEFSMIAGDFIQVYSNRAQQAQWNAVVTCFFLDTAHNPIDYIQVINHLLPIGGWWINLGPLLWHFEGQGPSGQGESQGSIELTLEETVHLIRKLGFKFVQRKTLPRQSYTGNTHSMLTYEYECEFWVAEKVTDVHIP